MQATSALRTRSSHRIPDTQAGHLATTILHTAGIDECAASAGADMDELVASVGRLKQSNGMMACIVGRACALSWCCRGAAAAEGRPFDAAVQERDDADVSHAGDTHPAQTLKLRRSPSIEITCVERACPIICAR